MRQELTDILLNLTLKMRLIKANQEEKVDNFCLTERQLLILELLSENGQMSVSQLSLADAGASDSTISNTVTRLWKGKLVTKSVDPQNQRITKIEITDKGRKIVEAANRQRDERLGVLLNAINLTSDEEKMMLNVFGRAIKFFNERLNLRAEPVKRLEHAGKAGNYG